MIQRIATRRNPVYRAADRFMVLLDRYQWLPLLIVFILLCIVNSVES